jgi:hypothetical protein
LLWGGTGQAKAVRPIIEHYGSRVVAVFDDTPDLPSPFSDVEIYRGKPAFRQWIAQQASRDDLGFCVAIGNPHGRIRLNFHEMLLSEGLSPVTIAHPAAVIADDAGNRRRLSDPGWGDYCGGSKTGAPVHRQLQFISRT